MHNYYSNKPKSNILISYDCQAFWFLLILPLIMVGGLENNHIQIGS